MKHSIKTVRTVNIEMTMVEAETLRASIDFIKDTIGETSEVFLPKSLIALYDELFAIELEVKPCANT